MFVLCSLTHFSSLYGQFMIDDGRFINQHISLKDYAHLSDFFIKTRSHHFHPLYEIVNKTLFSFFCKSFPLHVINFFLFYGNVALLYSLLFFLTRRRDIALTSAMIFCVLPMNAEIMHHITLNVQLFACCFLELSFLTLWCSFDRNHKRIFYGASVFFFVLALLCFETALLFPLCLFASLIILRKMSVKDSFMCVWPYFFCAVVLFCLWLMKAGGNANLIQKMNYLQVDFFRYLATLSQLIFWYIANLIYSKNIVLIKNLMPVTRGVLLWNGAFLGAGICLGILVFKYWKKSVKTFFLLWFLIGFLIAVPATFQHAYMGLVIEPYWFYFYSIGICTLVAILLLELRPLIHKNIFFAICFVLLFFGMVSSHRQHAFARTEMGYAKYWLKESPGNVIPTMILGTLYSYAENVDIDVEFMGEMESLVKRYIHAGHDQRAIDLLTKMIAVQKDVRESQRLRIKLAVLYRYRGDGEKYDEILQSLLPEMKEEVLYLQMADESCRLSWDGQGLQFLDDCLKRFPQFLDAYYLYGIILANQGRFPEAIHWWEKGLAIDSTDFRLRGSIQDAIKLSAEINREKR